MMDLSCTHLDKSKRHTSYQKSTERADKWHIRPLWPDCQFLVKLDRLKSPLGFIKDNNVTINRHTFFSQKNKDKYNEVT